MNQQPAWDWRPLAFNIIILSCALCTFLGAIITVQAPDLAAMIFTPTPTARATPTRVPTFTSTPWFFTATPTGTPAPPTPTNTRVITQSNVAGSVATPTTLSNTNLTALLVTQPLAANRLKIPARSFSLKSRLVLAHYFAWFDGDGWDDCNMSAGDKPLQPYESDDPVAIARHVSMARAIGLDGFTLHWFAPGNRTDRNFATLLQKSVGQDFYSTVVFSRHIFDGRATQQNITEALNYIIQQYGSQPNFLHVGGKPVIFFTDTYRVPTHAGQSPPQFWAEVKQAVDPQNQTMWIAEGLDVSYLNTFEGLYVFKISHATSRHDYEKDTKWAEQVRRMGDEKLWLATISPGWDDERAGCRADVRVPAPLHRVDRGNGAFYQATFDAAIKSKPNWLMVGSFNEWVEGSYIEPSVQYGDKYMQMTQNFIQQFKGR